MRSVKLLFLAIILASILVQSASAGCGVFGRRRQARAARYQAGYGACSSGSCSASIGLRTPAFRRVFVR